MSDPLAPSDPSQPTYETGDRVYVPRKNMEAEIADWVWHHKDARRYYFLKFSGKRASRRYDASELQLLSAPQ